MVGQTRLDIPVTIVDDSDFEGAEQFQGMLSSASIPGTIIDVPLTTVNIADNDRKFLCWPLPTKFYTQIAGYQKGVGDHRATNDERGS